MFLRGVDLRMGLIERLAGFYEPPALASLMTLAGGFLLTYGLSRRHANS